MKQHYDILLTKIFLILATTSGTIQLLKEIDLLLAITLKIISIVSFVVVIVINLPKFIKTIKEYFSK